MANLFFNLPAPAGDGVGAGVDTSMTGKLKTIQVDGVFQGSVNIEVSLDNQASWFTVATLLQPDKVVVPVAAQFMRVMRSGVPLIAPGLPTVKVSSNNDGALFAMVPVAPGQVDVSTFGNFRTVTLTSYNSPVTIEASDDGIEWLPCATFNGPGIKSKNFTSRFMRAASGTPIVAVGAVNDPVTTVDTDILVKATATDTTADFLRPKLAAGSNIALAVLNPGAYEQVQISATGIGATKEQSLFLGTTPSTGGGAFVDGMSGLFLTVPSNGNYSASFEGVASRSVALSVIEIAATVNGAVQPNSFRSTGSLNNQFTTIATSIDLGALIAGQQVSLFFRKVSGPGMVSLGNRNLTLSERA